MAMNPVARLDRLARIGTPRRTRAVWRALVALALVAAAAGGSWWIKARDNGAIAAAQALSRGGDAAAETGAAELRFAQAHELAARDQLEPALARYRTLYAHAGLGTAARYNSGNLMLRHAMALRDTVNASQALPLIELAKQSYREVLRAEPEHWDARYNFERAQRLLPDPDEIDAPIAEPRGQSERSPVTTRGVGGGMP